MTKKATISDIDRILYKTPELSDLRTAHILMPYSNKNRHFHNLSHVYGIMQQIQNYDKLIELRHIEYVALMLAALFHDIVYDVTKTDNEHQSAMYFKNIYKDDSELVEMVVNIIEDTKVVDSSTLPRLSQLFNKLDRMVLCGSVSELIEYGTAIQKEYNHLPYSVFSKAHIDIISKMSKDLKNEKNISEYLQWVLDRTLKVGVYAGSFNPLHVGHLDIIKQASRHFDKIILARGVNPDKTIELESITAPFGVEVQEYDTLLVRYVEKLTSLENYDITIIRGFRDEKDIASELTQRKYSLDINNGLNYMFLASSPNLTHISSSGIRTLQKFGEPVNHLIKRSL